MSSFVIALGSNLGNKLKNLETALSLLENKFSLVAKSQIYLTEPIEYLEQDQFLNMAAMFELHKNSTLSAKKTFSLMQEVEESMGRKKIIDKGPRNIDLDLIFFGNLTFKDTMLEIPHPSWQQRDFVIFPLLDLPLDKNLFSKIDKLSRSFTRPKTIS